MAEFKEIQAEYYKKLERRKEHQGSGEIEITEADELALDKAWEKRAERWTNDGTIVKTYSKDKWEEKKKLSRGD
jgi:hypothetical protein